MIEYLPRARRWWLAATLLALIGLLAWWQGWFTPAPQLQPEVTPAARPFPWQLADGAPSAASGSAVATAGSQAASPASATTPTATPAANAATTAEDEPSTIASCLQAATLAAAKVVDVVRAGVADEQPERSEALAMQRLRQDVAHSLATAADAQARAAGLLVSTLWNFRLWTCPDAADCDRQRSTHEAAALRAAHELASQARSGASADVYAWALHACAVVADAQPSQPSGACGQLSTQRWAELAPTQAWPALALAAQAQQRGDLSGVESAMWRVAHADDWRSPGDTLQGLVAAAQLPAPVEGAQDLQFLARDAALQLPPSLGSVAQLCPAQMDVNRREGCARLAGRMLDRASTLLELSVAIRVGRHAGLAPERLARAEAFMAEASAALSRDNATPGDLAGACRGMVRQQRFVRRTQALGELQAIAEVYGIGVAR